MIAGALLFVKKGMRLGGGGEEPPLQAHVDRF
jgi:hypothetical protein